MSVLQRAIPDPERQMAYPLKSLATARLSHLTGDFSFSYSSLPRKQSLYSFFQMVTPSYPEESPHNTTILDGR
jgi:hypothetical protein